MASPVSFGRAKFLGLTIATVAMAIALLGLRLPDQRLLWGGIAATSLVIMPILLPAIKRVFFSSPLGQNWHITWASGLAIAILAIWGRFTALDDTFWLWFNSLRWDALGAVGQILIAVLAVWVAKRQNEIAERLTGQQNLITQQQTIDAYFQGISDLVLDPEGQLEDWPLERSIARARTSAIMSGSDAEGKAKILRFLSSANLLTPLKRDGLLGRPILDGSGGYVVDWAYGIRVVSLGVMLAKKDLSKTDLRWCDLSGANFIGTDFRGCDLTGANLSGAILADANLSGVDLNMTKLFHGDIATASPRDRDHEPDFETGEYTGAIVAAADFSQAVELMPEAKKYICAWGGNKTRKTVPGGCEDVPNLLGR
ncbi:pentapeptide repeat protein [Thalassoporum mexicanum PCC 7367]|uniref:pentapeptide repeat-containing protein n=1 Tax=Thalassoporum mexicanum TaxID=3457544 RepID=UPI00029FFEE4|nr:pentapeptide repeat-containing protein [Pseudanabaena sp. PCC 7367]AFY71393.1 pentapeptide repeat protein [Pseudanabaena sp. PCC 7367]